MRDGIKIPAVDFYMRVQDQNGKYKWVQKNSHELFKKRILLFSVPGAFTPTCTDFQLPDYEYNYDTIRNLDIDEIYCISVNDAFVMNSWAKQIGVRHVQMIPDGNGDFTRQMGMLVDKSDVGLGQRSWRYSAVIKDGVVEKWFEEPGRCDRSRNDPYINCTVNELLKYLSHLKINS